MFGLFHLFIFLTFHQYLVLDAGNTGIATKHPFTIVAGIK